MANAADILTLPHSAGGAAKQVLHIGCGVCTPITPHASFTGWCEVRLDSDEAANPDIVASPAQMSKLAAGTMDAVYSYRSLQSLHSHEIPMAFSEIRRVLKLGGHALLAVTNLLQLVPYLTSEKLEESIYEAGWGHVAALDLLFGQRNLIQQGKAALANHVGFTPRSFGSALVKAGFSDVRIQPIGLDLWAQAVKGATAATSFQLLDPPATAPQAPEPQPEAAS